MQAPTALLAERYRFKSKLEAGTKAPTWLATDEQSGKDVVAAALGAARVAALMGVVGLKHPSLAAIVEVVDAAPPESIPGGAPGPTAVVVAEHVTGKTLHQALKAAWLTPAEAVTLWIRLGQGVSALHANSGAHGAISPRSIVLEPSEGRPGPILTQLVSPTSGAYCAPERLQGRGPSSADDTWALHATLFMALTGSPPFRGDTKDQLLQSIVSGQVQRLADFGITDEALQELLSAGLTANLARRKSTVDQMIEALERWTPQEPSSQQAAAEWEEDQQTIVASEPAEMAARMLSDTSARPGAAGPSLPPVAVPDYEEPVHAPTPPPPAQDEPNPFDDEDDATAIMGKPPIEDLRRALARGSGETPAVVPPAPAPPPQVQHGVPRQVPSDITPPPTPFAQFAPQPVPQPALPAAGPPPGPPAGYAAYPPAPAQVPAFPPPTSAYPPSIPAPPPTGVALTDLDVAEMRKANRGPLLVILAIVVLAAIGIGLLLFLNYRGIITRAPSAPGSAVAARSVGLEPSAPPRTSAPTSASARPEKGADAGATAAAVAEPAPATPKERGQCVAAHFEPGTLTGLEDFEFLCQATDFRGVNSLLHRRLVVAGIGKITPGMREWSTLGWFELAATAVIRGACCPAGTASVKLPQTGDECPQLSATLTALASRPLPPDDATPRATAFEDAVICLFSKGIPRPYNYMQRPTRHAREAFERFYRRAARRTAPG